MQPNLHPAGRLLDALSAIVWAPPLDKVEADNAESPKVVPRQPPCSEMDATGVELACGEGRGGADCSG